MTRKCRRVEELSEEEHELRKAKRHAWYYSRSPEYKAELLRKQRAYSARKKADAAAKGERIRREYKETEEQRKIHIMQNAVTKQAKIQERERALKEQGVLDQKVCTVCTKAQHVSSFIGANGKTICKVCSSCRARIYNTTRPKKGSLGIDFWVMKARRVNDLSLRKHRLDNPALTVIDLEHTITVEDLLSLYDAQNHECYYCGLPLDSTLHIDHKQPVSRGGLNCRENICITCADCNRMKWTKTEEEFKQSLLVLVQRVSNRIMDKEP